MSSVTLGFSRRIAPLARLLREARLWLLGAFCLLALAAAFQAPYEYRLDIGAKSDRQFVGGGIYPPEKIAGKAFRWTRRRADILLPAIAQGTWNLTVELDGWQPKSPALVRIWAGAALLAAIETEAGWQEYHAALALPAGDVRLTFETETFRPSDEIQGSTDMRSLGVKLGKLALTPGAGSLRVPPLLSHILTLTLTIMLVYVSLRRLDFGAVAALGVGGVLLLTSIGLVTFFRVFMNQEFTRVLLTSTAIGALFIFAGLPVVGRVFASARVPVSAGALRWLGVIVTGAFILKTAGVFYPQMFVIDAVFHLHRLQEVQSGNLFFTHTLWKFIPVPYTPSLYLLLSPLAALVTDDLALIKLFPLVLQTFNGFLVFFLARKFAVSERGALLAALLYLMMPAALIVFAWGIYANIFAQEIFLITLCVWLLLPWQTHRTAALCVLTLLFGVNMLAHTSMLPMLFVFWGMFLGAVALCEREARGRALWTAVALGAALLLMLALYFGHFVGGFAPVLELVQSRATGLVQPTPAPGQPRVPPNVLARSLPFFAREALEFYWGIPLAAAVVGVFLLWRRKETRLLALALAVGLATEIVFFYAGLIVNLYTRYVIFGVPFIALGAGFALERLAQCGRWGRGLIAVGALCLVGASVWFWIGKVLE